MKFILKNGSETKNFSFSKYPICIGSDPSSEISLPLTNLQTLHIKIIDRDGTLFAINEANDPFVSLNGLPFRKAKIRQNDVLDLAPSISISFEEQKVAEEIAPPPTPIPEPIQVEPPKPKKEIKPIEINDIDDEKDSPFPNVKPGKVTILNPEAKSRSSLKVTCTLVGLILILLSFIGSAFYTRAAEQIESEEITAAEGVADIAMALMYAQVNNLKPKKHNWSDPEFIKNNLAAVITHDCPALSNIDGHGQFSNCPYLLRTYTSADFSHFLVIAQPNPSVFQWLIPKKTIVIDSHLMELRKVQDVRVLNRMLVNANMLDVPSSMEITKLIEAGEMIPLSTLAAWRSHHEFTPPKALALMYAGAENKIYNAPRYYQFGESVITRALSLGIKADNMHERSRLKQEMEILSRFPDMVLYSSHGMETAMQTRKALRTILPEATFILGYLRFNSKGHLVSSNLIMDQDTSTIAEAEPTVGELEESAPPETQERINIQKILENVLIQIEESKIDEKFSLVKKLERLAADRRGALQPVTEQISRYLHQNLVQPIPSLELEDLVTKYVEISKKQDSLIIEGIIALYQEFIPLPIESFLDAVKSTGLGGWIPEGLE